MDKLLWLLVPTVLVIGMLYYVFRLSGRSFKENWDYAKFVLDRAEIGGDYPTSWEEYDNELDIINDYAETHDLMIDYIDEYEYGDNDGF